MESLLTKILSIPDFIGKWKLPVEYFCKMFGDRKLTYKSSFSFLFYLEVA